MIPQRHECMQCQNCFKSKGPGVTLFRCSGCNVELYCSKECQRSAWSRHKLKCQINSRAQKGAPAGSADKFKALRAFTAKHRPTISEVGIRALELGSNIRNAEDQLLLILVEERQPSTDQPRVPTELSYKVRSADVVPYDMFGEAQAEEMRAMWLQTSSTVRAEEAKEGRPESQMASVFFAMLLDEQNGVSNIAPVGFSKDATYPKPKPWRDLLMKNLNEGIVL